MRSKREIELFINTAFSAYANGAQAAAQNANDGGACNFDYVVLKMRHGSKKAVDMLNRIGLRARLAKRGVIHISSPFGGQALRRTVAVEAICETFIRANLPDTEAYVYYLTD